MPTIADEQPQPERRSEAPDLQAVVARVQAQARRLRLRRLGKRLLGLALLLLFLYVAFSSNPKNISGLIPGILNALIALTAGGVALSQSHKNDLKSLAELNDPDAIGPLSETLRYDDSDVRTVSERALIRLLPLATGEHAAALLPNQLESLHQELKLDNVGEHSELMQAIIRALPIIGNDESLVYVRAIAQARTYSDDATLVRETASQTLPLIQKRVEEARLAGSLLRPVEGPPDGSGVLLRPAAGSTEGTDDSLLRPIERSTL